MSARLLTVEPPLSAAPFFDLFKEELPEFRKRSKTKCIKQQRLDFIRGLREIRQGCERTYHEVLLDYCPVPTPAQPPIPREAIIQGRGVWYTDPHLLCRRSDAAPLIHALHNVLPRCSHAVSLGDEFDFGWAEVPDPIDKAVDFKRRLARRYPGCTFHTLGGNHDGSDDYLGALEEASKEFPNIKVERYVLKLGRYLFTHGDCIHRRNSTVHALEEYRKTYHDGWKPNLVDKIFDRATHFLGLHCTVPKHLLERWIPRTLQAERIIAFIKHLDPTLLEGVTTICFGHTHKSFRGFEFGGFRFVNGGSHEQGFSPSLNRFTFTSTEQAKAA